MKLKYLIFDELIIGFDVRVEEEVVEVICFFYESGYGILLIIYDMDFVVRLVERVVFFYGGWKFFDGLVEEFFMVFDVEKYGFERFEVVELGERFGVGFVRSIEEIFVKLGGEV